AVTDGPAQSLVPRRCVAGQRKLGTNEKKRRKNTRTTTNKFGHNADNNRTSGLVRALSVSVCCCPRVFFSSRNLRRTTLPELAGDYLDDTAFSSLRNAVSAATSTGFSSRFGLIYFAPGVFAIDGSAKNRARYSGW